MSAIVSWRIVAILRRCSPTRRVSQTKSGSSASAKSASRQSSRNIATTVAITVVTFETIDVAVEVTHVLDAADVVRDPRLHLARARAGEEREREPLEVAVDGGAQVVHHALADLVREERLDDAEHAGGDGDRDHPGDEHVQQLLVVARAARVEDVAEQERRDRRRGRGEDDEAETARAARGTAGRGEGMPPEQRGRSGRIKQPAQTARRRIERRRPRPRGTTVKGTYSSQAARGRRARRWYSASGVRSSFPSRPSRGTARPWHR